MLGNRNMKIYGVLQKLLLIPIQPGYQVDKEPLHVYVDILPLNLIIFTIKSVAIYMNS